MKVMLFVTILLSGLLAGLFYAYSCSVNPGLGSLTDREYLKAMQSINKAILNPYFFLSFMGLLIMFPVVSYFVYHSGSRASFHFIVAAAVIYLIGVLGVTAAGNVPLNEKLARFSSSLPDEISAMRAAFEAPWNSYHRIRTFASIISFALTIAASFKH